MRALSLWQPWADLVVDGIKRVENRRWPTKVHGPVLVHAALTVDTSAAWRAMADRIGVELRDPRECLRGGIIGVVDIVDCVDRSDDPWFCGPFGFVLAKARRLDFVACKGRQRFFYPPADVLERLRAGGLGP